MIKNLEDIWLHNLKVADLLGGYEKNLDLIVKSTSKEEIKSIEFYLKELPTSYTSILLMYDLNGKVIENFSISPGSYNEKGIVKNIRKSSENSIFGDIGKRLDLYFVGTNENFGIFVSNKNPFYKEGEILLIDEELYSFPDMTNKYIHKAARNFEQFLIIAGNLDQIGMEIKEDDSNKEGKHQEFLKRLKILNVDPKYHNAWNYVF